MLPLIPDESDDEPELGLADESDDEPERELDDETIKCLTLYCGRSDQFEAMQLATHLPPDEVQKLVECIRQDPDAMLHVPYSRK